MNLSCQTEAEQPVSTTFIGLSLTSRTLRDTPDCLLKTCCKKYKKGKRCKSCPKK